MNPEEQSTVPQNDTTSAAPAAPTPDVAGTPLSQEVDSTTLHTIEALESEPSTPEVAPESAAPVVPSPVSAESVQPASTPAPAPVSDAAAPLNATEPLDTPAPAATPLANAAPVSAAPGVVSGKKKSSKGMVVTLVVVLVILAVAAGYFVWQAL